MMPTFASGSKCLVLLAAVTACALPRTLAADAPASQPAPARQGDAPFLDRMRSAVESLELDDATRDKVDAIFDKAREDSRAFRRELAELDSQERRDKLVKFGEDLRARVSGLLNEAQRAALKGKMGAQNGAATAGDFFGRVRTYLDQLKLDEKQQKSVRDLLETTRQQLDELRADLQSGDRAARGKAGEIMRDTLTQVNEILSPEQRQKFRDAMASEIRTGDRARPNAPSGRAATRPSAEKDKNKDTMMSGDGDEMMSTSVEKGRSGAEQSSATTAIDPALSSGLPRRGQAAPDLELKRLGGSTVNLSSFKGRVVLLVFGSYSCPSFRQRAAALEELRDDLGTRASVMLIYTREAHAADGWEVERNKDDGISIKQPRDADERETVAERTKQATKLSVPILLDDMKDSAARAFGAFPNGAVLIGRDGNIAYRQQWFDPVTLRRHIDAAVANKTPTTQPAEL